MQSAAHQEKHFQQYIINRLVEQGWKLGDSKFYGHIEQQDSELDSDAENLLDDLMGDEL